MYWIEQCEGRRMPRVARAFTAQDKEDHFRARLAAGGFSLVSQPDDDTTSAGQYEVRNGVGDVVFGRVPIPFSATLERVEAFLRAQVL